jgi:transketolase
MSSVSQETAVSRKAVSAEASAFAGHFGLDNLILIYDANEVTLDAMAGSDAGAEDAARRFQAYGFDVQTVDGTDMTAFLRALKKAKKRDNGKPQMIIARTLIGKGIPEVAGTAKAHGEGGAKFAEDARRNLGLPAEPYFVSRETRDYFTQRKKALLREYRRWEKMYRDWQQKNPELAQQLDDAIAKKVPADLLSQVPAFPTDTKVATRKAGSEILQPLAREMPFFISGSADLHGSTLNYIEGAGDFSREKHDGRNIRFGIREHGMCAILNGVGYHGVFRPSGATFLVFADYCRPSIRLSALSKLPNIYIFTHDSIGVGEDGPTHQPVETVSGLRVIPQLDVIRPADPEETAGAFVAAFQHIDGPTLLSLTRQVVPMLNDIDVNLRREGVARGGYVAVRETAELNLILLSCGSELQHAVAAAKELGGGTRVGLNAVLRAFRTPDARVSRRSVARCLPGAASPSKQACRIFGIATLG